MTSAAPLLASALWFLASPTPQVPPPLTEAAQAADLLARREAILARERAKLPAGAARPEPRAADGSSRFVVLAEVVAKGGEAKADPTRDPIRLETAAALVDLANRAAKGPSPAYSFADECLRLALERQPNHAEARRLLGFVPRDGGWATPFAVDQLAQGNVADPTFGWVAGDWVPHLVRGELPAPNGANRWLPTAEADALRRSWSPPWQIRTEHFEVRTDVPLSDAISFGRRLEDFHQLFFALMADVIGPDLLPLAQRYKNPGVKPATSRRPRHQVYYFATRDEYARHLAPIQGAGAKVSLGTYVPKKESPTFGGISYFFKDDGGQLDVTSTLYHEASHQLLFESAGPNDYTRNVGNYWVFEGLGTYFETVQPEPGGILRFGGLVGPRIAQARLRLLQNGEFIPIRPFVALNQARFQDDNVVYLHYAESMALAVFLMQAHEGRHREGFLDYVRDAYRGRVREGSGRTLEDRVGVPYRDLDREFLEYLAPGQAAP